MSFLKHLGFITGKHNTPVKIFNDWIMDIKILTCTYWLDYFSKRLSKINEVKFGSTISYYQSYYTFIHLTDYYNHLQHLASTVVALQIGHEFLINRFGFDTDLGIKVVDPFYRDYFLERDNSLWYKSVFAPKVGFKFYPIWNSYDKQRLALGMYIKTNGLQADFVEYSLSYSF